MSKPSILIISASVRKERKSHRLSLFFQHLIEQEDYGTVEMLDLKNADLPLFDQRLSHIDDPDASLISLSQMIKDADGVLIVTPEYNGGYPASLKNFIDFLYPEWDRKATAIATVSSGAAAGSQVLTSLVFSLWKMHALLVPEKFQVANIKDAYTQDGIPTEKEVSEKYAKTFIEELLWTIKASRIEADYD